MAQRGNLQERVDQILTTNRLKLTFPVEPVAEFHKLCKTCRDETELQVIVRLPSLIASHSICRAFIAKQLRRFSSTRVKFNALPTISLFSVF
jgi:hypothetical protein